MDLEIMPSIMQGLSAPRQVFLFQQMHCRIRPTTVIFTCLPSAEMPTAWFTALISEKQGAQIMWMAEPAGLIKKASFTNRYAQAAKGDLQAPSPQRQDHFHRPIIVPGAVMQALSSTSGKAML